MGWGGRPRKGVSMKLLRIAAFLAAAVALTAGVAGAHPDDDGTLGFHDHLSELLAASPPAPQASSKNVEVLAHVYPGPGTNADVYAHEGYAYLASWVGRGCLSKGVRVYDLSDPRNPEHVSTFADAAGDPTLVRTWTEKVIVKHVNTPAFSGDLAVVSFQTCSGTVDRLNPAIFRGFALYDVTDPSNPEELARYATEPGVNRGSHEIWLETPGGKAYVYTAVINSEDRTGGAKADFRIVDVSDPTAPVDVGQWGAQADLGRAASPAEFVHSVITNEQATLAYLSYWDLGTVILDISNPAHPVYLGRTNAPASHSAAVGRGGNLLVETHEIQAGVPTLYDISDPTSPVKLSDFVIDGFERDTVHDPRLRGHIAAFSWYSFGVQIADISRPDAPRLLASFIPEHDIVNPDFFCTTPCTEVWGAYIHRDYYLASDMNSGLWVFRVK
jgi:hypothetical protein